MHPKWRGHPLLAGSGLVLCPAMKRDASSLSHTVERMESHSKRDSVVKRKKHIEMNFYKCRLTCLTLPLAISYYNIYPICSHTVAGPQGYTVPCVTVNLVNIFRDIINPAAIHAAKAHGLSTDYKFNVSLALFTLHYMTSPKLCIKFQTMPG